MLILNIDWVSEFAPPKHQKVLSYLTGMQSRQACGGLLLTAIPRLALRDRLAGLLGQCLFHGRRNTPRPHCPQQSELYRGAFPRHSAIDCDYVLCGNLQHGPCSTAAARGRMCPVSIPASSESLLRPDVADYPRRRYRADMMQRDRRLSFSTPPILPSVFSLTDDVPVSCTSPDSSQYSFPCGCWPREPVLGMPFSPSATTAIGETWDFPA